MKCEVCHTDDGTVASVPHYIGLFPKGEVLCCYWHFCGECQERYFVHERGC